MTLRLTGLPLGSRVDGGPTAWGSCAVLGGEVVVLEVEGPARLLRVLAGLPQEEAERSVRCSLDGARLPDGAPGARLAAGLAVATCTVPSRFEGPLLELVLLVDRRSRRARAAAAAAGARRTRAAIADGQAAGRALAGRLGLARWIDRPPAAAPPEVRALADVTRALLAEPAALVARFPRWLPEDARGALLATVEQETARRGIALLWVDELRPQQPAG
jgi:hypothetical protein